MNIERFLQVAVFSVAVLGAQMACAEDVGYTSGEQRLHDLELRLGELETAGSGGVNLAGFNGCDTNCGDGCDSCGSGVECGSGCGRRTSWLCPCPTVQFDAEFLLFAVSDSEPDFSSGQNDFNGGLRLTYSRVNEQGRIFRARYFNFGSTLEGGGDRIEMEEIDAEIGRRFTLGGGLQGEFTGGVRYAAFDQRNSLDYDNSFGPLVSMQLRGRKFLRGTSFVNLRQSWQFGDASDSGSADVPGTFRISEVQFGLEWRRAGPRGRGTWVFRTAFEAQNWAGIEDADSEDLGLYGTSSSVGLAF